MEENSGGDDLAVSPFAVAQGHGGLEYPAQVHQIMRAIAAVRQMQKEFRGL